MNKNVVVCLPVRNEEEYITDVMWALCNQSLNPIKIIVTDDGSTDRTVEILQKFNVELLQKFNVELLQKLNLVELHHRPYHEHSIVGKIEMAEVFNSCLTPMKEMDEQIDYVLIIGGDTQLSKNYISDLVTKFEEDNKLQIASGTMVGEFAYKSTGFMIPGPARMIRYSYWSSLGGEYPLKHGWESYPVYRANMEGWKTKVFDDIVYTPLRVTGGRTDYRAYGMAMKAYGYFLPFSFGRALKQIIMKERGFKACFSMMRGFLFGDPELYEPELRKFINKFQRKRLRKIFFRF